jgi:hypothetical protein
MFWLFTRLVRLYEALFIRLWFPVGGIVLTAKNDNLNYQYQYKILPCQIFVEQKTNHVFI